MGWLPASLAILAFVLVTGFAWYERSHPSARVLALIATLAALAALGRIAFAPLPSVKPTTDIVLLTGYALGGAPGFAVGAVGALASNLFFGQGPWTPWQMGAWGAVGVAGALLARVTRGRRPELGPYSLAAACAAAGLAYGGIMNFSLWATFSGDHTLDKLAFYYSTSLPFDIAHAAGNVVFCLLFGPALVRALRRYRARFEVTWRAPAPAAALPALLAAIVVAGIATAPAARADAPERSVKYLLDAQNRDGGFGGSPGQSSTQLHTGWAGLGLAAAGRSPLDVRRGGTGVLDYVAGNAGQLDDLGALARTILLYEAAGRRARVGSRDLVAGLAAKQRRNGSFAGRVNTTAFAVLALRAAGRPASGRAVRRAGRWIAGQANRDGGFNFGGRGGPSGVDDTGAALQALAAAGRRRTPTVRRAARYLVRRQNDDGGFPLQAGAASNAQSTAWAVQGLQAAGRDVRRVRQGGSRHPLAYLESLIGDDGAVRYSRTSRQTPVWVTAQALAALAEKPFPLATVARRRGVAKAPAAESSASREAPPAATPRAKAAARTRTEDPGEPLGPPAPDPALASPGIALDLRDPAQLGAAARDAGVVLALTTSAAW